MNPTTKKKRMKKKRITQKGYRPMKDWTFEEFERARELIHAANEDVDVGTGYLLNDIRELGRRGWTAPMQRHDTQFTSRFLRLIPPERTDETFVALYTQQDGAEFNALSEYLIGRPCFERWKPLLQQCVRAYHRQEYLLVVPCLLSVFEGALAAVVDQPIDPKPRKHLRKRVDNSKRNLDRFVWMSIESFADTVFQSATFAGSRPNLLNRHWVLHGRDAPAWSQADCLRLFQALEAIASAQFGKDLSKSDWWVKQFQRFIPADLLPDFQKLLDRTP